MSVRDGYTLRLASQEVDIEETRYNSEYFNIFGLRDEYGKGIYTAIIRGSDELRRGSLIGVEIIDDFGRSIPINLPSSEEVYEETYLPSRRISFEIDDTVSDGKAIIYFVGELQTGERVRWKKSFNINKQVQGSPLVDRGDWENEVYYDANHVVQFSGSSYKSVFPHKSIEDGDPNIDNRPPDPSYWKVVAQKGEKGDIGISNVQYVISPLNGTAIKNNSGSIELQLRKIEGDTVYDVSSGSVKLSDINNNVLSSGGGISDGGNGVEYNPIIDASAIEGNFIVKAIDTDDSNEVRDTISLFDVTDGLSGGYIETNNGLILSRDKDNNYSPSNTLLTASFIGVDGTEFNEVVQVTPSYSTQDTLEWSYVSNIAGIILSVTDSDGQEISQSTAINTKSLTFTFTFTDPSTSKVTTITETINIVSDGVDGIGGANAKAVKLTVDNQAIEYNTDGGNPSPNSVSITASAQNTEETTDLYYKFFVNGVEVQHTTSNAYNYSPESLYANMPEIILVEVREDGTTNDIVATDQVSIFGVKAGSDAFTIIISNEAHTLPETTEGGLDTTGSGTNIEVYEGALQLDYDDTVSPASSTYKVEATGTNVTIGSASTDGDGKTRIYGDISAMSDDAGFIEFTITCQNENGNEIVFTRKQSFAKSKQGQTGNTGKRGVTYVYQGIYDVDETYVYEDEVISDVVLSGSNYYYLSGSSDFTSSGDDPATTSVWQEFEGQYKSLATDILLAQDVTIRRILTMGSNALDGGYGDIGIIQSYSGIDNDGNPTNNQGILNTGSSAHRYFELSPDGISTSNFRSYGAAQAQYFGYDTIIISDSNKSDYFENIYTSDNRQVSVLNLEHHPAHFVRIVSSGIPDYPIAVIKAPNGVSSDVIIECDNPNVAFVEEDLLTGSYNPSSGGDRKYRINYDTDDWASELYQNNSYNGYAYTKMFESNTGARYHFISSYFDTKLQSSTSYDALRLENLVVNNQITADTFVADTGSFGTVTGTVDHQQVKGLTANRVLISSNDSNAYVIESPITENELSFLDGVNQFLSKSTDIEFNSLTIGATNRGFDNAGNVTANDATFHGDVIIQGNTIQVDSQISTSDAVIDVNDGEAGSGVTLGYAGLNIDRGSGDNYWFGFDEVRDRFTVGQISSLSTAQIATTQVVATRPDSPSDNGIAVWDNSSNWYETRSGLTFDGTDFIAPNLNIGATGHGFDSSGVATVERLIRSGSGSAIILNDNATTSFATISFETDFNSGQFSGWRMRGSGSSANESSNWMFGRTDLVNSQTKFGELGVAVGDISQQGAGWVAVESGYKVGTTTVIDSSRNFFGAEGTFSGSLTTGASLYFGTGFGGGGVLRGWNSTTDADIESIIEGSTSGAILESSVNAHMVIGIRGNDTNDAFYILGTSNTAAYNDDPYDTMVFRARRNGDVYVGNSLSVTNTGSFGGDVFISDSNSRRIRITDTRAGNAEVELITGARGIIGTTTNHEFNIKTNGVEIAKFQPAGHFDLLSGDYRIGSTTVIDSSRNATFEHATLSGLDVIKGASTGIIAEFRNASPDVGTGSMTRGSVIRINDSASVSTWGDGGEERTHAIEFYSDDNSGTGDVVNAEIRILNTINQVAPEGAFAVLTREHGGSLTERFRISANGRVGIGTDSPDSRIHINSAIDLLTFQIEGQSRWKFSQGDSTQRALKLSQYTGTSGALFEIDAPTSISGNLTAEANLLIGDHAESNTGYTSGILGSGTRWDMSASGGSFFEVDNARIRGDLRAHIFKKDIVQVSNAYLMISDSGVVSSATGTTGTGTVTFKDADSASFSTGDTVWVKGSEQSTGTSINSIKFRITSSGSVSGDGITYDVSVITGDLSDLEDGMTGARINGGSVLIDASSQYSPFIDVYDDEEIFNWTGSEGLNQNTDYAGGDKWYFSTPYSGQVKVSITGNDFEGGARWGLNGVEISSMSGADGADVTYDFWVEAQAGVNEISIWASNGDGGVTKEIIVEGQQSLKSRFGNLSGISSPIFGQLEKHGSYINNLYAEGNVQIAGTLTAGDANGVGNTFYAGRIRKNLVLYSEGNGSWFNAPTGGITALWQSTTGTYEAISKSTTLPDGTTGTVPWIRRTDSGAGNIRIYLDNPRVGGISDGDWGGRTITVSFWLKCDPELEGYQIGDNWSIPNDTSIGYDWSDTLSTEWKRIVTTFTVPFGASGYPRTYFNDGSGIISATDGIYIWGMQVEESSEVSSYQPTNGTVLSSDTGFGMWAVKGGFGGTIQNPVVSLEDYGFKLNGNSSSSVGLTANDIMIGNITGAANSAVKLTQTGTNSTSGLFGYTSGGDESFALKLDGTASIAGLDFNQDYLSGEDVYIGRNLPNGTNRVLIGTFSDPNNKIIRVNGNNTADNVQMRWYGTSDWGLRGYVGGTEIFSLGSDNQISGWGITSDVLTNGNLYMGNNVSTYDAEGRVLIGDWDGTGTHPIIRVRGDGTARVHLKYNSSSDWGLFGFDSSGSKLFQLGNENVISGWNIIPDAIYQTVSGVTTIIGNTDNVPGGWSSAWDGFTVGTDTSNRIWMARNTSGDYEFRVWQGGSTVVRLGSAENKISGWNVDTTALYTGTKVSNGNFAGTGDITIGSAGYISANQFRIDTDGSAYFKGNITGGNITGGSLTIATGGVITNSGSDYIINEDKMYFTNGSATASFSASKFSLVNSTYQDFPSPSGSMLRSSMTITGFEVFRYDSVNDETGTYEMKANVTPTGFMEVDFISNDLVFMEYSQINNPLKFKVPTQFNGSLNIINSSTPTLTGNRLWANNGDLLWSGMKINNGLQSVSVADDAVEEILSNTGSYQLTLHYFNPDSGAVISGNGSTILKIAGSSSINVDSLPFAPSGTDGTDGVLTIFLDTNTGDVYINNREGSTRTIYYKVDAI